MSWIKTTDKVKLLAAAFALDSKQKLDRFTGAGHILVVGDLRDLFATTRRRSHRAPMRVPMRVGFIL